MLDHLGLNVPDLAAAKTYYDELMPLLGYEPFLSDESQFSYQPSEGTPGVRLFFYLAVEDESYSNLRPGLQHVAFHVDSRSAVEQVHAKVTELGSEVVHPPQPFPQYHQSYYATFWHDPHQFLLEAVCHVSG